VLKFEAVTLRFLQRVGKSQEISFEIAVLQS